MSDLEFIACNLCGESSTTHWLTTHDRGYGHFHVVRCTGCGLAYVNPRPTEEAIAAYYPESYYVYEERPLGWLSRLKARFVETIAREYDGHDTLRHGINNVDRRSNLLWRVFVRPFRYKLRKLPPYVRSGRILDIGCATGRDLDVAKRAGWVTHGVDISAKAAAVAQYKGHDVFVGRLPDAQYPGDYFDAVTIWDVMEHLHDPMATLWEINRILKLNGHLLGKALNVDSIQAQMFRRKWWPGMDVPRHLFFYTPRTLRDYLDRAGFELVHLSFLSSPRCMSECIDLLWCDALHQPLWKLHPIPRLVDDLVALPWPFIFDALGRGDAMIFHAVKRQRLMRAE